MVKDSGVVYDLFVHCQTSEGKHHWCLICFNSCYEKQKQKNNQQTIPIIIIILAILT